VVKILICAGARGWSTENVIRGVTAHSKYKDDIEITFYWIGGYEPTDWDLIYIHSGAVVNGPAKNYIREHRDETKWIVGVRGPTAFKRNIHTMSPDLWDGFSSGSIWYHEESKRYFEVRNKELEVPGYVCHGGINYSSFEPRPFPENFVIGWAGAPANGTKRFRHFLELPFDKVIATRARGFVGRVFGEEVRELTKAYNHPDMVDFYERCSVYVNTSYREGGPIPPKEAGACGRPSVITRTGDGMEWVPEEYIVDDYQEMTPIIERFKNDKDLLVEEGKRFRELAKRWDFSIIAKEYDIMFESVMNG
jgi:glycosyltransferase involved in cell wall biosynthesis